MQRLDKIISSQLGISRSEARKNIRWGKVTINGKAVRDPSISFEPNGLDIKFKGNTIEYKEHIYIVLNKPKGIISASNDKARQTVVDLVPSSLRRADMFPVGRLDRDTTGILIITDDGDFAHKAISPKSKIPKTYMVELDGKITKEVIDAFKSGVVLADGQKCQPAELVCIEDFVAKVTITEGKYHQIKRMFGCFNLGVNSLKRVSFGGLALPSDLEEGECRELTNEEFNCILYK